MFFFKRQRAPKPTFSAALAPDEPFFAVGDVHGRLDLLKRLIDRMTDIAPESRQIFVGDYIDRGEHSLQTLQYLHALQKGAAEKAICLKGNHEDMLLQFLAAPEIVGPRWMRHGGLQTLASMSLAPPAATAPKADWEGVRDRVAHALGQDLIGWLTALPVHWKTGNVSVVHAGAAPNLPIEEQPEATLIWGDPQFETLPRTDGIWVVHGHTIVDIPCMRAGRIGIDTGAYATGRLSAVRMVPGQRDPEFLQA